jgi:nucleoside-diphosphate-sugar epimerase
VGTHPTEWLDAPLVGKNKDVEIFGEDRRLLFLKEDFRKLLRDLISDDQFLQKKYNWEFDRFTDVFHFAAIVGGRAVIDGDPMMVALDLSIDAEFFYWITRQKPERVLYPSSSAAYPVNLQTESYSIALKESDIDFSNMGQPDMTYGWSKLTGEYLAKIASEYYGVHITCIRPFSGYGEDQDLTYPIPAIALRVAKREDPMTVWGSGKQGRDFVHIDDVLDCIFVAMEKISDGTAINIGMGKLTSFLEIIKVLTKIAGYDPVIKPLLDKPVGVYSRYCDMSFVNNTLGWKANISVENGMRRVYEAALRRAEEGIEEL